MDALACCASTSPATAGASSRKFDWEHWFATFDERKLVFVFQEHKSDGSQSNFFQLDNPDRERA